jgi:hypothetical protein
MSNRPNQAMERTRKVFASRLAEQLSFLTIHEVPPSTRSDALCRQPSLILFSLDGMMARFETMDRVALVIAAPLIAGGFFVVLVPQDFAFGRAANFPKNRQETLVERVTPRQSRIYGLLSILAGAGLSGLCPLGITVGMKQRLSSNQSVELTATRRTFTLSDD